MTDDLDPEINAALDERIEWIDEVTDLAFRAGIGSRLHRDRAGRQPLRSPHAAGPAGPRPTKPG